MILENFTLHSAHGILSLLFAFVFLHLLVNKYGKGLNKIPGPQLAGFTDLWRLLAVWSRRAHQVHIQLHEKYGPIVRVGQQAVSIADPEAIKILYNTSAGFVKSGFYPIQQTIAKGGKLEAMFNTTNEQYHAKLRRAVSNAYAMSTLVTFEPFVDSTTVELLKQFKARYANRPGKSGVCDFGVWLQYYAFDVIGELTYSKRLGFVDNGVDVDHIIRDLEVFLNYASVVGQMPFLDYIFLKNPIRVWMSKKNLLNANAPVADFAKKRITERRQYLESGQEKSETLTRRDFLNRFREAQAKDPEFMNEQRVLALATANMVAGSDTTAITLRAVFYYLLINPPSMEKLLGEFAEQTKAGRFSSDSPLVQWEIVRDLPYLSAVINEALRCHPAVGLTLERVVPPQGVTLAGHFLPGGTIAGCSAWVLHRHKETFGSDAEKFRPERWIEASPEQRIQMNNSLFSFGAGARTCVGKNISLLEMYKLVPAILRAFEIELVDPESPWKLHTAWFVKQSDFKVRLKEREKLI